MQTSIYPFLFASIVILVFGLIEVLLIRLLHRDWWQKGWIRWSAVGLPLAGIISIGLWGIGTFRSIPAFVTLGAVGTPLAFVLEIALMCSLPFSGALEQVRKLLDRLRKKRRPVEERVINPRRRVLLKAAAAALPMIALTGGAGGVARGFGRITMPGIAFSFSGLPPSLDGLRILHLSDLHLGLYLDLTHLESVLVNAEQAAPDLVLVTGDIADELEMLPDALRMISEFDAPLGHYASLGNHEYYRGIREVQRTFDAGPVPLLVDQHVTIPVNGTSLAVAGADDPRSMHNHTERLRVSVQQAVTGINPGTFTVLMSHRPEGLDHAAEHNIPLTLSGHTHGAQIGLGGRSALEPFLPSLYLWGKYAKGSSQLYTTSGMGHWFPFRLGCPPEAPIIVLNRA